MALSLREKIALQREVKEGLDKLKAGVANLRDRIALQRKVKEGLDRLKGISSTEGKSDYDRLMAGEFNHLYWENFITTAEKIFAEEFNKKGIESDNIEEKKKIVEQYILFWYDSASDSMKKYPA